MRQFAADLLQRSGERPDAARRHFDHLSSRLPPPGAIPDSATYEGLAAEVDNLRSAVEYATQTSRPEAAVDLILAFWWWWENLGLVDEQLNLLDAALRAADASLMPLDVLSAALSQASTRATYLGRIPEAMAFAEQLARLRDEHPEMLAVRSNWAFAVATLTWYRAGGDRSHGNRLMLEAQAAAEALGLPIPAAYAAGNIPLAAILWDAADDPEVARAIRDGTLLAQTAGLANMAAMMGALAGVIRVIGGASNAYQSTLLAFAELDDLDRGWLAEWAGLCVGVAAEVVGDLPVAAAHSLRFVHFCRRSGVRIMLACGVRGAARLSATAGHPVESLRLWGGAEQIEAVTGMGYMPLVARLDLPLRQQCTDALGPDAARLVAEGASWSVAEATEAAEGALQRLQPD